jgi:hypothetical protein
MYARPSWLPPLLPALATAMDAAIRTETLILFKEEPGCPDAPADGQPGQNFLKSLGPFDGPKMTKGEKHE